MTTSEMMSAISFESFNCQFLYNESGKGAAVSISYNMSVRLPSFFNINCTLESEFEIDELEVFTQNFYLPSLGYHQGYDDSPIQYPLVIVDEMHKQVYSVEEWFDFCEKYEKQNCLDAFLNYYKKRIFNEVKRDFVNDCGKPTLVESKKRLAA